MAPSVDAETRLRMERVVAAFRQRLAAAHGRDAEWTRRYRAGDEGAMEELLALACAEVAVPLSEFHEAVDADPKLSDLHQRATREALLGAVRGRGD